MAKNLQELGQKFQDLASRSLQEQVRVAQRYNEFVQKFGRGDLLQKPVQDEYRRFVGEEATQYMSNLASLHLNYYEGLMELGRTYQEKFYNQVVAGAGGAASSTQGASAAASPKRVEIELRGTVGQDAVRSFVLESKHSEASDISFLVSDFVGPEGTAPFRADVEFQPGRFTLRPGEERVITLRLPLSSPLFVSGLRYTATAVVRGYDDLELGINVFPSAPATNAAGSADQPAPIETSS
jgi:hypothetical protein